MTATRPSSLLMTTFILAATALVAVIASPMIQIAAAVVA